MNHYQLILNIALSKSLIHRAVKIAIVVGIILNLINQGDTILHMQWDRVNFIKMGLTFTVPFCVSMYTAIAMKIKFHIGEKAVTDATLLCKGCQKKIEIKQEEIIPFCDTCKDKTAWKIASIKG